MIKLYDIAMSLVKPDQRIILKDKENGKITFDGDATQLLYYPGLDYNNITDIRIKNDVLTLWIK